MIQGPEAPAAKPGVKTSEFWLAVGSMAASAAVSLGLIPQDTDLQHAVSVIMSSALCLWISGQYITGRNGLKSGSDGRPDRQQLLELLRQVLDRERATKTAD